MTTITIHLVEGSDGRGNHSLMCNGTEIYSLLDPYRPDFGLGGGIYKAELADIPTHPDNEIFYYSFSDPVATCKDCINKRIAQISIEMAEKLKRFKR